MADRTLVKNYLRDAKAAAGAEAVAQIAWLEARRAELSKEVGEGDIATTQTTFNGQTNAEQRGLNAQTRLAAVIAALEQLECAAGIGTDDSRPALLSFRFSDILS